MAYPFKIDTRDGKNSSKQDQLEDVIKEIENIIDISDANREYSAEAYKNLMRKMWELTIKMTVAIYRDREKK